MVDIFIIIIIIIIIFNAGLEVCGKCIKCTMSWTNPPTKVHEKIYLLDKMLHLVW